MTSEKTMAARYPKVREQLRRAASDPNVPGAERKKVQAALDQPSKLFKSLASARCPDDGSVNVYGFADVENAQLTLNAPYSTLGDAGGADWQPLAADTLGKNTKCFQREDRLSLGDGESITRSEACLVAIGRYLLQIQGMRRGFTDSPPVAPGTIEQTQVIKAWFEAGAK